MGTKTIGLIGVDFTNDHFNRNSGVHQLSRRVDEINKQYKKFAEQCKTNNIKLINLSKESKITSLEKGDINLISAKEICSERNIILSQPRAVAKIRKSRRK